MRILSQHALILFALLGGEAFPQATTVNLATQSRNPDFATFSFTRPESTGSSLPATCQIGQLFFNTSAASGQNLFGCTQANVWSALGTVPPATSTTLGGVTIPSNSGLAVSSGALSVLFGTGPNTALQGSLLGQANGAASLNSSGQVPSTQLPLIPSKTSQLTNDAGFVTSGQAASAAPVQSVNGQTGAVVIPSGNYQTVQVNGANQSQQPTVNFAAGANVTLTGSSTGGISTVTISASSGSGGSVTSGTSVPSSGCTGSTNLGAMYIQTGANGQTTWMCGNNGSSYKWLQVKNATVNVMDFGCKADGVSDDSGCFNSAIGFAKNLSGGNGGTVYVPTGIYGIGSPIYLPRTGGSPVQHVVSLIGQDMATTILVGLSTLPQGYGIIEWDRYYASSSYTSTSTTLTINHTLGTSDNAAECLDSDGATIPSYSVTYGTSSDTFTFSTAPGQSGTCMVTQGRTYFEAVKNFTIEPPNVPNTYAIHGAFESAIAFAECPANQPYYWACPNKVVQNDPERFGSLHIENIWAWGSDQYTPAEIYIEGDCNSCVIRNIIGDASLGSAHNYETVTVLFDTCLTSGAISNEGCGLQYGSIENVEAGFSRFGNVAAFQGRIYNSTYKQSQCNGMWGGLSNSQCYAFINSGKTVVNILENEGLADAPQILIKNSSNMVFDTLACGTPNATASGSGTGDCIDIRSTGTTANTSSWGNTIRNFAMNQGNPDFSSGTYLLSIDTNSHGNKITQFMVPGTAGDFNIVGTNNFVAWCSVNSSPSCESGSYSTIGTVIY
jgi:Pectate lyase superfamily protein